MLRFNSSILLIFCLLNSSCTLTIYDSSYYLFADPYLMEGKYRAAEGDWVGAAEVWSYVVETGDAKSAAKAAFNMACACEVLGRPNLAIQWAQKAAFAYNFAPANKKAEVLLQELLNRYGDEMACKYR